MFCRWLLLSNRPQRSHWSIHTLIRKIFETLRQTWPTMISTKGSWSSWKKVVNMKTLENTFIPKVFKERTWTKLLILSGIVFAEIIREFFANALVEGERINCWVRGREFYVTKESIQEILEVRPLTQQSYIQYDDRLDSLVPILELLGGNLNKRHWTPFLSPRRWGHWPT